jgi:predicted transcriptional regulator
VLHFQQTVAFYTPPPHVRPKAPQRPALTKREKEILDIVYARGHATAAEVREDMAEPPTDAAVRTTLRVLVAKGHVRIQQDGPRYDYWPTVSRETARRSELKHVVRTFFGGSVESALSALLDLKPGDLSEAERRRLKKMIDDASKEGR